MSRTATRRRSPLVLIVSLLAIAVIAGTAAISIATEGSGDRIDINFDNRSGDFTFGSETQSFSTTSSPCYVPGDELDGPILEVSASTYDWRGRSVPGYVGLKDSNMGVNKAGRGNSHYCQKIDYLSYGRSEQLTLSLGALPISEKKLIESADLRFRIWSSAKVKVEFFLDGDEIDQTTAYLSTSGHTYYHDVTFSTEAGVFDSIRISMKSGSAGLTSPSGLNLQTLKESTSISTVATESVTVGSEIFDEATVLGGDDPEGTVTFKLYSDDECTNEVGSSTVDLGDDGTAMSEGEAPNAGTYYWIATYSGDDYHYGSEGECGDPGEVSEVLQVAPTISTEATSEAVGTPITDTATLSGAFEPSGNIDFALYDNDACEGDPVASSSNAIDGDTAMSDGFTPNAGTYYWMASYAGDVNNAPADGVCGGETETSVVSTAVPTIDALATPVALVDETIMNEATITGYMPTGTVTFKLYDDSDCTEPPLNSYDVDLVEGSASTGAISPPAAGTFYWRVFYSGDVNNDPAESDCGEATQISEIFEGDLACFDEAQAEVVSEAGPALEAVLERLQNTKDSDCTDLVEYTFVIEADNVYFDFNDTGVGARFLVRIEWDPSDPIVNPITPTIRYVNYYDDTEANYVPGVACLATGFDEGANIDPLPDADDFYEHPPGIPVCLAGQIVIPASGGWQQIQWWDVIGDPRWSGPR